MNVTDVMNLLPETDSQISVFSAKLIEAVNDGNNDPLKAYKVISNAIKALETAKNGIKDNAILEAEKFGKTFDRHNAKFSYSTRTNYDFKNCNDEHYNSITTKIKSLTESKKNREKFLKTIEYPLSTIDENTGEVFSINPPAKTYTDILSVKNIEPDIPEADVNNNNKDLPF